MERVIVIPAMSDNYMYLFTYGKNKAIAVDPAEAGPVLKELKRHNLELAGALTTHHHWDHNAGIKELKDKTGCAVIEGSRGPADGETLNFDNCRVKIITTPGHTADSVCFYIEPSSDGEGILFTGDTLFIAGCGRPIENDMKTMWESLQKLSALPESTLVYPGHNYTESNYEFALVIEPGNRLIQKLLEDIRQKGAISALPTTIAREKQTNVFFRANAPAIKAAVNMPNAGDAEVFAELRTRKNIFD